MRKLLAVFVVFALVLSIAGCTQAEDKNTSTPTVEPTIEPTPSDGEKAEGDNWDFYNELAETFVIAMANGDFDSAVDMFDPTMKQALPASSLKNDLWDAIVAQAGAFTAVHEIENLEADGYYICFTTSRHENMGVKLRIVFSKDGLVAGLFVDDYPVIDTEVSHRNGFSDYPVVIGEGTDFPLNGILSVPENGTDKVPAVVLVHGSGASDMNESIYENKPFLDIAEYLAANGVAVIRYNKRTFSHAAKLVQKFGSSATVWEETIEDAILAAEMLKNDSRIDENKVFILGHSLGGMLAPRIHAEGGDFAGIISLAGSPRSLLEISYDQTIAIIEETMNGDEKADTLLQMETVERAAIEKIKVMSDEEAKNMQMAGGVSAYYYKEMDEHPVSELIEDIQIPFLIMQGEKDFQVYAGSDFILWQELLGGRTNTTFKLYEGLNHLFMTSTGRSISEYQEEYKIANKVDNQVLIDIAEWIKAI